MSGPKVVRIVTREELAAICRRRLARLDEALAQWERRLKRLDLVSDSDVVEVRSRRDRIAALFDRDEFEQLQEATVAETSFLKADAEERLAREAERQARIRISSRRLERTAATLSDALARSGSTVPTELTSKVQSLAAGESWEISAANAVLNEAFAVLASDPTRDREALTEEQQVLAAVLGENGPVQTLEEWLDGVTDLQSPADKIDHQIAELEGFFGEEAARPYVERVGRIRAETDPRRRRMLADTLVLELARETTQRKRLSQLAGDLGMLDAELAAFSGDRVAKARQVIAEALDANDEQQIKLALEIGRSTLDLEHDALAAATRRSAVLAELGRLGYEVREGMATALAEANQVIVRKARNPDYGVEILAPPGGKLQVRTISFGDSAAVRDAAKDRDMETIWCSEFDALAKAITDEGGEIAVERAIEAGAMPLKIVPRAAAEERRRFGMSEPRRMTRKSTS